MNYIYDIYINLNKKLYDFFEWNKKDKIVRIKKIPLFKIENEVLREIIGYNIKIDDKVLKTINNKTECWNNSSIQYCSLFCDNNDIIAIEFDKNGNSINRSFLYIEDELDVLESIKTNTIKMEYTLLDKIKVNNKTRKELYEENFINNELKNIKKEKLDYIFFECFGKKNLNKSESINLIKGINKNSKTYKKLYNILKLTSTTENKML